MSSILGSLAAAELFEVFSEMLLIAVMSASSEQL